MTVSNIISVISAFIIAAGWFVTGYLNRRKNIDNANSYLSKLVPLVKNRIRKELNI